MIHSGTKMNCCRDIEGYSCDTAILFGGCSINKSNNTNNVNNCKFSNKDLIMIISDASTREIVNANDAACEFYGYTKEEILSKHINDINNLTSKETYEEFIGIKDYTEKRFTAQHKMINGELRDLEVYSNIFTLGNRELVHSIIFDITDKIKHEKELKESKERYKKLVQLSPHAVIVHTGENFIFVNKAGAKLFEIQYRKELIGLPIKTFILNDDLDNLASEFNNVKRTKKQIIGYETKVKTALGNLVDVSMSSNIIQYDGQDVIMTILVDISERKEKERLLKKAEEDKKKMAEMLEYDKLKTEFFTNISHELRTPINVILGSLQLADKYGNDFITNPPKFNKLIKAMKQNCLRLLRLINNLLDITKIDSGYYKLNLKNGNIIKFIEDITFSVASYVENKGIKLAFDTNLEEKIMAFDPEKLERAILNLLSNAIKFTSREDKIKVSIYDQKDEIIIEVEDTGIGIPKEEQNVIFDRFRQVERSLTRSHEGSGIGLSLVKSFVDMHDGSINVDSEQGKGSKFVIRIPAKTIYDLKSKEDFGVVNEGFELSDEGNITKKYIERIEVEFSDIYL